MSLVAKIRTWWHRRAKSRVVRRPLSRGLWVEPLEMRAVPSATLGFAPGGSVGRPPLGDFDGRIPPFEDLGDVGDGDTGGGDTDGGGGGRTVTVFHDTTRLYQDLLHRTPNQAELNYWSDRLNQGTTWDQVARGFTDSDEYRGNFLRTQYRGYLGRDPGAAEVNFWLDRSRGMRAQDVTAAFLSSEEFYQQQGGNNSGWLNGVYGVTFGRAPDMVGFAGWFNRLKDGTSRFDVATAITGSTEATVWTVAEAYQTLLRRDGDLAGAAHWVGAILGGLPPSELAATFTSTPEYLDNTYPAFYASNSRLELRDLITPLGNVADNGLTSADQFTVFGVGTPGRQVVVFVDGRATLRGRIDQAGRVMVNLGSVVDDGVHAITVRMLDGTEAFRISNTHDVTVDQTAPSVELTTRGRTDNPTPTVRVQVTPNDNLPMTDLVRIDVDRNQDGLYEGPREVNHSLGTLKNNQVTFSLNALEPGTYTLRARVSDAAGNEGVSGPVSLRVEEPSFELHIEPRDPDGVVFDGSGTVGSGSGGTGSGGGVGLGSGGSTGGTGTGGSTGGGGLIQGPAGTGGAGSGPSGIATASGPDISATAIAANDYAEIAIAVNPVNEQNIVIAATANDAGGGVVYDTFFSLNGGATWRRVGMNFRLDGVVNANAIRADPTVNFDTTGRLYVSYLIEHDSTNPNDETSMVVARSTDGGQTYRATFVIRESKQNGAVFNDKQIVATGRSPTNPNQQNVYIAWVRFGLTSSQIMIAGSVDGGVTFSTPIAVSDPSSILNQGAHPVVGLNGEIYVSFVDLSPTGAINALLIDSSPTFDGTAGSFNFSQDRRITTVAVPNFNTIIPAQPNRDIGPLPVLAIDKSNGPFSGRLYLAYSDLFGPVTSADFDIFLAYSSDQGRTWTTPKRVINDDSTTTSQFNPWVAVDPRTGAVVMSWRDARLDPLNNQQVNIFTAFSIDGGVSFSPNIRISDRASDVSQTLGPNDYLEYDGLDYYNNKAYYAWSDNGARPNQTKAVLFDTFTTGYPVTGSFQSPPQTFAPDDRLERNDTSDVATNLGTLGAGTQQFIDLNINRHDNGLVDYDWYRYSSGRAGTATVRIDYPGTRRADLHLRVFTLNSAGTLVEIGNSLAQGVNSQQVSVAVPAGAPLLIWVYGFNYSVDFYTLTVSLA